ncbi:S8 family peptidase [Microbaculum marinum]|uniref:S8 family serine peptidase n=1 Tax=Microbaculum marinum TaxID=1764581 RepID=A0AAW9RQ53_9HYPH
MAIAVIAGGVAGSANAGAMTRAEIFVGDGEGGSVRSDADRLLAAAETRGAIPIIVTLRTDFAPEAELSMFAAANQRTAIASLQDRVLARVPSEENVKTFKTVPMVAMTVNERGLQALLSDSNVAAIHEDIPHPPTLDESVPIIKANKVWKRKGKTGKGWTVAVLDTGVDRGHRAFRNKIVSEACFSTNSPVDNATSVCPRGVSASTKRKSGKYCDLAVEGCDHGTHVAGIAVGNPNNRFKGVAKGAKLIPIQVFTRFENSSFCTFGDPCALSFTSDQIAGLERVFQLRNKFKIASVNMSLGGSPVTGACKTDPLRPIIQNLRSAKIATVIASGNNSATGAISAPACIPEAIAVGATDKDDTIAPYSNQSKLVDVMAPGSDIHAPVPKNSYGTKSGTSMATPHVAGTWAVLKQRHKNASVSQIEKALECTGKKVRDRGPGKPRIDVLKAYGKVKNGC